MFTPRDEEQIIAHGLSADAVRSQLDRFSAGFPYVDLVAAATPCNGIATVDEQQAADYAAGYRQCASALKVVKFVPASGAATRMFKEPYAFLNERKRSEGIDRLIANLDRFAFYESLKKILPPGADDRRMVSAIVGEGLAYGTKPKALILFHAYSDGARTALEEHLSEGALYAASNGEAAIHFTLSPEHIGGVRSLLEKVLPRYESQYGITYRVSWSIQKPSTDTVAVNPDNTLFRNQDGSLLFRPAGHGALIENLNELDADLVFIKNIDNVTTDGRKGPTVLYKQVLAGMLLALQREAFELLRRMDGTADEELDERAARFLEEKLFVKLPPNFGALPVAGRRDFLRTLLDRPIRVCGMVRNDGEPGGGPFWVRNPDGTESLQIVESNQIAPEEAHLMQSATHFNPVDLVCGLRDYQGRRYDLKRFVDPATGFISTKSKDGRELKALELPGLWNGAMARWNTVFLEVPLETFSPVKEVNDLLRPEHQP